MSIIVVCIKKFCMHDSVGLWNKVVDVFVGKVMKEDVAGSKSWGKL